MLHVCFFNRKLVALPGGYQTASKRVAVDQASMPLGLQTTMAQVVQGDILKIESYNRIERGGTVFSSHTNKRRRHMDHFVSYEDGEGECHGVIHSILIVHQERVKHHLVAIQPFLDNERDNPLLRGDDVVPHISSVKLQR